MYPRNSARISQVPTFADDILIYSSGRSPSRSTRDIPVRRCHNSENMVGWKRTLPKCRQDESDVLAAYDLSNPCRHYHGIECSNIPWSSVSTYKYLGLIIDRHRTDMGCPHWQRHEKRRLAYWNVRETRWQLRAEVLLSSDPVRHTTRLECVLDSPF